MIQNPYNRVMSNIKTFHPVISQRADIVCRADIVHKTLKQNLEDMRAAGILPKPDATYTGKPTNATIKSLILACI